MTNASGRVTIKPVGSFFAAVRQSFSFTVKKGQLRKMQYNESQSMAIDHFMGPALVLAGPGSGKTAVVTKRVCTLIEKYNVNPSNILV